MGTARPERQTSALAGYVTATLLVGAALAINLLIGRILTFSFFLAATTISAWYYGTRVGIFALVLSILVLTFVLSGPAYEFGIGYAGTYPPRLVTFVLSESALLWAVAALRRTQEELRHSRDQLDEKVRERTESLTVANRQLSEEIEQRRLATARLERTRRTSRERVLRARFKAIIAERTRLAREIHDTLLQGFTGVSLQLMATARRSDMSGAAGDALHEVIALAQKTLTDARQAIWDIRPPALEENELSVSLRAALEAVVAGTGLALEYSVRGEPRRLRPEVETTVFRVAQEAVTNAVKHARAHSVVVKLAYGRRTVALLVADDGQGFAPDSDLPAPAGSWGTLGMRERAAQLGGKLFIRSADGSGTKVELRVPTRRPRGFPDRGIAGDGSGNVL